LAVIGLGYRECRAVGSFPADTIVRQNAAIIREVENAFAEAKKAEEFNLLVGLVSR